MEKTFTVVGTSVLKGVLKVRVANDIATRCKVLERNGHDKEFIKLVSCDAMTKLEAAKWLAGHKDFQAADTQAVIAEFIRKQGAKVVSD